MIIAKNYLLKFFFCLLKKNRFLPKFNEINSLMMQLPARTVQRLSKYRRLLLKFQDLKEPHIFSHDLARLLQLNPVQVRRDLMLIGVSGNHRKGYNVKEIIELIGNRIDNIQGQNVALIGVGNLGKVVVRYLKTSDTKMNIIAAFDIDNKKINKCISGINCHNVCDMRELIKKYSISIAVITVPPDYVENIVQILIDAGIKGILNFTSTHIDTPPDIYLIEYDMITSLEEIAYFVNRD